MSVVSTAILAVMLTVVFSSSSSSVLLSSSPVTVNVLSVSSSGGGSCAPSSGTRVFPAATGSVTTSFSAVSSSICVFSPSGTVISVCSSVSSGAVLSPCSSNSSPFTSSLAEGSVLTAFPLLSSADGPVSRSVAGTKDSCAVLIAGDSSRLLSPSSVNIIISVEAVSASAADTVVPTEPINIVIISPVVISLQSFFLIIRYYSPLSFLLSSRIN